MFYSSSAFTSEVKALLLEKQARMGRVAKGTLIGGGLGAATGAAFPSYSTKKKKKPDRSDRVRSAVTTGLGGAAVGALHGAFAKAKDIGKSTVTGASRPEWSSFKWRQKDPFSSFFRQRAGGRRRWWEQPGGGQRGGARRGRAGKKPSWVGNVKDKAEANKKYRAEAMKNHPDRGGSETKMKDVNARWDAWKKSPEYKNLKTKLSSAFLAALARA